MNSLPKLIKPFLNDKIITGSIVISASIFIGSVINYLTQIFLGRFMNVEDYGTFNSLFSLTLIISIPSVALFTSLIKTVANLRVENDFDALTGIFKEITKYLALIGLFLGGIILIFQKQILAYLNIYESALIYPFSIFVLFSLLNNVPRGYLQGLLRFKGFGFYTIFNAILRLVVVASFVLLGFRTVGALYGVTTAALLSYLLGLVLLRKNFTSTPQKNISKHFKKLLTFSVAVLVIRASLTMLSSIDLILVKHFFNATEAGIYAGLITIGKVILFGTSILSTVMFTIISDSVAKGENYIKKLIAFFGVQLLLVVGSVLIFSLFPTFITYTMFGKAYTPAIVYLPKYALSIGLYSIVNFIYQFLLAVESSKSYAILVSGVFLQLVLINLFHPTLDMVININILTMCVILLAALLPFKKKAFGYNLK